jgi:integrase
MARKKIRGAKTLGDHGRTVRVWPEGKLWRVRSRSLGIARSFAGEGSKERALGFAERLLKGSEQAATQQATVADLWAAYRASSAWQSLRPRSQAFYAESWALFTEVVPHGTPADEVKVVTLDTVRMTLEKTPRQRAKHGLATNTVRRSIGIVKTVFRWGERTEFLARNRTGSFVFTVGKDQRVVAPAEYSQDDLDRLMAVFSFDRLDQRTPLCVLVLIGHQGVRVNAALHLRWEDVDWESDAVIWRAEWDKTGREWDQPLRRAPRAILGRLWATVGNPKEGWVFPAKRCDSRSPVYTPQSFYSALRMAQDVSGVERLPGRAAHSFRRKVAGDVVDATGSAHLAMEAIGDKSVKQAETYVKRRRGRTAQALRTLDERGVA